MSSYQIVSIVKILFNHSMHFGSCFLSRPFGGHHFGRFLHSQFSASFSNYSNWCLFVLLHILPVHRSKYSLISSWSLRSLVSKYSQVSSFVFQFYPVICAFATFIFNSYGGSFKISLPSLSYRIIRFFQIPPMVPWRPSQVYAISLLILSTRISSVPNPLFVINWIGEG